MLPRFVAVMLAACLIVACEPAADDADAAGSAIDATPEAGAGNNGIDPPLPLTRWALVEAAVGATPPPSISRVQLSFTDTAIGVRSGCNSGGGTYMIRSGHLEVGDLVSTLMACPPPLGKFERALHDLLEADPAIARDGAVLVLTEDERTLRFRELPQPSADARPRLIHISPERVPCGPEADAAQCLQYRERDGEQWQLRAGGIEGFDPRPGVAYSVRILEEPAAGPGEPNRWLLDVVVEP